MRNPSPVGFLTSIAITFLACSPIHCSFGFAIGFLVGHVVVSSDEPFVDDSSA